MIWVWDYPKLKLRVSFVHNYEQIKIREKEIMSNDSTITAITMTGIAVTAITLKAII